MPRSHRITSCHSPTGRLYPTSRDTYLLADGDVHGTCVRTEEKERIDGQSKRKKRFEKEESGYPRWTRVKVNYSVDNEQDHQIGWCSRTARDSSRAAQWREPTRRRTGSRRTSPCCGEVILSSTALDNFATARRGAPEQRASAERLLSVLRRVGALLSAALVLSLAVGLNSTL